MSDNDNHLRRVRYNASCITANVTNTGSKFEEVPNVYVIYISKFDIFGDGRTIYHVEPTIQENGRVIDNGLHEIYVNTIIDDGTEIAELMQCFLQKRITNNKFKNLKNRVEYLKDNVKEVLNMSGVIERYAQEYAEECVLQIKAESVDSLIENSDFSLEEACRLMKISVEQYKEEKQKQSMLCKI